MDDESLARRLQRLDDGARRQVEDRIIGHALWGGSARLGTMLRADYDRADQREGAADEQHAEDDHQQPKSPHRSWPARALTTGNALSEKAIPAATQDSRHSVTSLAADAGERLDRVLAAHLGDLSRSRLKHLILEGSVTREGATISDPAMRVKPGQTFDVAIPEAVADRPLAQTMDLDIRYEDDHLLVIDKPAGLVVHPAPGNPDRTLVNALLAHCGDSLAGIGGVKRPGIVHRLDKNTSGLMVVAKSEVAHARLSADFAARRIGRAYFGVVWGVPLPRSGDIAGNIGRSPVNRKKMAVVSRGGRTALTHYRVLREFHGVAAAVECRLATGRTHQIRVHMSERGHGLIGDPLYGGARRGKTLPEAARARLAMFFRQALHAQTLGFTHPISQEPLEFISELPSDIKALLAMLEEL
jgi:23S rRNA pseudouridine1911/1915/1917 synthase